MSNFIAHLSIADQICLAVALATIVISVWGIWRHEKRHHDQAIKDYPLLSIDNRKHR